MFIRIDPRQFVHQKLLLVASGEHDFTVHIGDYRVRRIFRLARSNLNFVWTGTLTDPVCVDAHVTTRGDCPTIEEERGTLCTSFDGWLKWARLQHTPVGWHE